MLAPIGTVGRIKAVSGLRPYLPVYFAWQDYIRRTATFGFHAYQEVQDAELGPYQTETKRMDYAHRFTPTYQKGQIAGFYQLEAWLKDNPHHVTLLTLTAYQAGKASVAAVGHEVGLIEAFDKLKWGWDHLSKILRKEVSGLQYVGVLEPHKSGYPHYHFFLLTPEPLTEAIQKKCALLWSQKYNVGDAEHGLSFDFRAPKKEIGSIRNYLSKYLCKAYYQTVGKYPNTDSRNEMTAGRFIFYALVWKYGWRLVQKSNVLSSVMAYRKKSDDTEYCAVELSRPVAGAHSHSEHREFITVWERSPGIFDTGSSISRSMAAAAIEDELS
jgi:hypothetical protein